MSTAHHAVAFGISESAYVENTGRVSAVCGTDSTQNSMACGLTSCTDSYNTAPVSADHTGSGQSIAWGCNGGVRCVNEGAVDAEGIRAAGACGLNSCTDSSNSGRIYALSKEADGKISPTVYSYGWRNGSGCASTGTAEAVGSAFALKQGDREGWAWYTAVDAGNSAEVKASVSGFYSVTCTPGNPVPVYLLIVDGVYQGTVYDKPASVPEHTIYSYLKTFSADGNTTPPEQPRQNPAGEGTPCLLLTGISLFRDEMDRDMVKTIGINCGSMSFDTGLDADPEDPASTDYSKLTLRISLHNIGSGASGESEMELTLPEGFSFDPNTVRRTGTVSLPALPVKESGSAWIRVYPLYSENYKNGDTLMCEYSMQGGAPAQRAISGCKIYMPQKQPCIAQVYYDESALYPGTLVFKYYEWNAEHYLESSDRYRESVMRLSVLLSQAAYLYQDGDTELANDMMSALGLSLISVQGDNTVMGCKRLYAKKTFIVKDEVYELFITSILGATDIAGWLGSLAFVSVDKYHAGFLSIAQEASSDLKGYVEKYNAGGHIKYLATGHSRGGASANLLGAMLDKEKGIPHDDIFCYTFGAPNCVKDGGELDSLDYKNIFNIINFNDVVGYIPGCYSKYGVSMVYECETDTVSAMYIAPIREFSTDEMLLGNANALRLQVTLAFLLPQLERVITKHLLPYYIEDIWVLDLNRDKPISMKEANLRQDEFGRKYMDWVIDKGEFVKSITGYLGKFGWKAVKNLTKLKKRQSALIYLLLKVRNEWLNDKVNGLADDMVFSPIKDEIGRDLIRTGIMYLRCPVNIHVYDSSGKLAAAIENDWIMQQDSKLAILIEGSHKMIYFPLEEQYSFEITGYSDGTMDVQYYETDDQGALAKIENYRNVPVQANAASATIQVTGGTDGVNMRTGAGDQLAPQSVISGGDIRTCYVSDISAEDVHVLGCGAY